MQISYRGLNAWTGCLLQFQINQNMLWEKGKRLWEVISISAEEKTRWKTWSNVERWNGLEKEATKKKKAYSSKSLSLGKMDGAAKLSQQRILSAKSKSEESQMTTIYQHPLLRSCSTNNPWESISELISEKWLFHSPDDSPIPHKFFLFFFFAKKISFWNKINEDLKWY